MLFCSSNGSFEPSVYEVGGIVVGRYRCPTAAEDEESDVPVCSQLRANQCRLSRYHGSDERRGPTGCVALEIG